MEKIERWFSNLSKQQSSFTSFKKDITTSVNREVRKIGDRVSEISEKVAIMGQKIERIDKIIIKEFGPIIEEHPVTVT